MEKKLIIDIEAFNLTKLEIEPPASELQPTPDGKAKTLPISFIETKLQEIFMGQWGTDNFRYNVIGNEIIGAVDLWVIHPITQLKITRQGVAAIQIMVDKAPDNITGPERNKYALDIANKKPNALYLGSGKLKAEAIKNAALSLGKVFGRDINRKFSDQYEAEYTPGIEAGEVLTEVRPMIAQANTNDELIILFNNYPEMQNNREFKKVFNAAQAQLKIKKLQNV